MQFDQSVPLVFVMVLAMIVSAAAQTSTKPTEADVNLAIRPEPRDEEWWTERHTDKLAEKASRDQIDVVMIGDSITHSWETTGKATWDQFYASRNVLNLGFSGDRTEHVLWRLADGAVAGLTPKLVIVLIGTNNAGHRQESSAHTAAGVRAVVDDLKERLPAVKILLLGVFPRGATRDDPLRQLTDGTNKLIQSCADGSTVFYLDIADAFLDENGGLPESLMPDGLHPNERGYEVWAAAMEPKLQELGL